MYSPPQASPTFTVAELKDSGNALFNQGRYQEAIQLYTQALEIDPSCIPLYQNRALCHLKLSNFPELRANCDLVLQLEPYNIKALVNRSSALSQLGLLSEAIADLRLVISLGADEPALLQRLRELERRAQQSLSQLLLPQPSLAQLLLPQPSLPQPSLPQHNLPQPSLPQQKQPSVDDLRAQGSVFFQSQNFQQALACCNQALLLDPHNINLLHNRGLCYLNLGLFFELKSNSDALLLLDPGNVNTLVNRATAWEKLGDLDSALQDLRTALNLNPTDQEIPQWISHLEAQRGGETLPQSQSWSSPAQSSYVGFPAGSSPQVVVSMPDPFLSESVPLLGSLNDSDHFDHPPTVPICVIRWFEYPGLVLSLVLLGWFIYQATQALSLFQKWSSCTPDHKIKETCSFQKAFATYFIIEFVGDIIQSLNSAHGSFAFLFRSALGLEYYSSSSTGALVWQGIQTICLIVFSQLKSGTVPVLTIVTAVVGWIPIITSILAGKLRFLLLTWNVPTQFTFLDDCLGEDDPPQHSHCMPHNLKASNHAGCTKIYRCTKCRSEWKRT